MQKLPPFIQELLQGGARTWTGVLLAGWGFAAVMALLTAVTAYQNRAPDPFRERYAAFPLPEAGDVDTTASVGGNARFDVFAPNGHRVTDRPDRMVAELDTLRQEIIALRRSADTLRRQNEQVSGRLARLEQPMPERVAQAPRQPVDALPPRVAARTADDDLITGSIGNQASQPLEADAAPRSDFAIDLGAYSTLGELAAAWRAMTMTEAGVIGNLTPLAALAETGGKMEARLVAGPFANAADAAAACARLDKRRIDCKPTFYAGQPLPPR